MPEKKILHVITKSVWGGAQKYAYDLAINLPQDRFETVVAAGGNSLLFEKLQKAGIRTIAIPGLQRDINIWKELAAFWHLFKIFRAEKPDIIHLNSTKAGVLGALAAWFYKISNQLSVIIFTVHGWGFKEDRSLPMRMLIFAASWFSSLFQDKIILINTADFRAAQKFIPRRKLSLIFNGIGPIDFLPRREARAFFAKKIGREISDDTILMGTNAELIKNKGLTHMIDALSRLNTDNHYRGFASIVIGDGEDRSELQAQTAKLGLQGKVFLPGFILDAAKYLKAFDIFILPSLKEGLPYTIMEAMAAGLPIAATAVGGIPDLIQHKKSGLAVPPASSDKLAGALKDLLGDPMMRASFGQEAKKVVGTKFQLRDMVEKTVQLYLNG